MPACRPSLLLAALVAICALLRQPAQASPTPERAGARRADGQTTPLLVYRASVTGMGCAPLAVISHGAGGSENGYRFIVQDLAARGYTAIVMGHRESGVAALRTQILRRGLRPGVRALVVDPVAERARLLDVDATLVWANAKCTPPFRVLLGHSMGAESVMLEAGVRNMIDLPSPPAGQDRFDAYVALSPEGPGLVFPEHAWSDIDKPMLTITGTRDESLAGGPEARQIPWRELPGNRAKCQWLGVIDGATHMNLAGIGSGAKRVEDRVLRTIASFLTGVRRSACEIPAPEEGVTLSTK